MTASSIVTPTEVFKIIDSTDPQRFADLLTADASLTFANNPPMVGTDAIVAGCGYFYGTIKALAPHHQERVAPGRRHDRRVVGDVRPARRSDRHHPRRQRVVHHRQRPDRRLSRLFRPRTGLRLRSPGRLTRPPAPSTHYSSIEEGYIIMATLDGKVAIVTGGGGGIGRETVRVLIENGARVAVADINADAANEAAEYSGGGGDVIAVKTDVTDVASSKTWWPPRSARSADSTSPTTTRVSSWAASISPT